MKTVITKKIDDYNIIIGFGIPQIDPIATNNKILLNKEIITLNNRKELFLKHTIYFQCKKNESVINDNKFLFLKNKLNNLNKNELLTIQEEVIKDYRGTVDYKKTNGKWSAIKIDKLNVIAEKDTLTKEESIEFRTQIEKDRISNLSPEEKDKEKQTMLNITLNKSVEMRSGLEIQDDPDALAKSRAWYNEQIEQIDRKYE